MVDHSGDPLHGKGMHSMNEYLLAEQKTMNLKERVDIPGLANADTGVASTPKPQNPLSFN